MWFLRVKILAMYSYLSVDHARGVAVAAIRVNFERIYSSSRMVVVVPPHWLKVN